MLETDAQILLNLFLLKKDDEAYRILYAKFYQLLLFFAKGYLKSKEPAEEIVNDVLYKVWSKKDGVSQIYNLRFYLFTAVRNKCLTELSKSQKERDFTTKLKFNEYCLDDPESVFISSELSILIKETIEMLPPRCKQIYELIKIDGRRNKDVAEHLNISINTVDAQLAIAIKCLIKTVYSFQEGGFNKKV